MAFSLKKSKNPASLHLWLHHLIGLIFTWIQLAEGKSMTERRSQHFLVHAGKRFLSLALRLSRANLGTWPNLTARGLGNVDSLQRTGSRISLDHWSLLLLHYNSVIHSSTWNIMWNDMEFTGRTSSYPYILTLVFQLPPTYFQALAVHPWWCWGL